MWRKLIGAAKLYSHTHQMSRALEIALRAHVDVLAHAIEDTRGFTADHLQRMIAEKMALIPTLHLFDVIRSGRIIFQKTQGGR